MECRTSELVCLRVRWLFLLQTLIISSVLAKKFNVTVVAEIDSCDQRKHATVFVGDCHHKLQITLKIYNLGETINTTEYIKVDEARDKKLDKNVRLYNAVVLQIRQEQVSLIYPFHKVGLVNNKAYEVFLTKDNTDAFPGCDGETLPQLCGYTTPSDGVDEVNTVQQKKGFCCPCLKDVQERNRYHLRGGQDCTNKTGNRSKKDTYHSSAHCLKFDPVWYSVNEVGRPHLEHMIHVQAFIAETEKHQHNWLDVTGGEEIMLGSQSQHVSTANHMVSASHEDFSFDPKVEVLFRSHKRLLIPRLNPVLAKKDKPLQMKEGPSRYLLVNKDKIDITGKTCDKIGVSYEAFVQQKNRCTVNSQSCLSNQPMHYWLADVENHLSGLKGEFFLSNYVKLGPNPILTNTKTGARNLAVKYTEPHTSSVYFEFNADGLLPLHEGISAQISRVYFGIKDGNHHVVIANVFNRGWVSAFYYTRLARCNNASAGDMTQPVTVHPHHSHEYVMSVNKPENASDQASCVVEVLNGRDKMVAAREITFKHRERCICEGHCLCECMSDDLVCHPMSQEQYHVAGFRGQVPALMIRQGNLLWQITLASLIVICLLLIIGLFKAIIGTQVPLIGRFGLFLFTTGKHLPSYHEKDLWGMTVLYDSKGVPVHPLTGQPVRRMSMLKEFTLNTVFLFYVPFMGLHYFIVWIKKRADYRAKTDYVPKTQHVVKMQKKKSQSETKLFSGPHPDAFNDGIFSDSDGDGINAKTNHSEEPVSAKKSTSRASSRSKNSSKTSFKSKGSKSSCTSIKSQTRSGVSFGSKESVGETNKEDEANNQEHYPGSARKYSIPMSKRTLRESVRERLSSIMYRTSSSGFESPHKSLSDLEDLDERSASPTKTSSDTSKRSGKAIPSGKGSAYDEVLKLAKSGKRVYYNFTRRDDTLKNSGSIFSLCGSLTQEADAFRFSLDIHKVQVYENVNGERQELDDPQEIDLAHFSKLMSASDVLQVITLFPLYPCLNKVLLNQSDSGGSIPD